MHLLNLELENWSCHSRLNLDLSNGVQIEGRNGSGKTSILEAIRFAFAQSALGYKNRIKNGERSAIVRLSFMKDDGKYTIEKELFLEKSSTAKLICNDTVIGDNPGSVHRSMQNILDENILDKLLYIPQGGLTSIVESLSRKEGRKELDSLFGLEKFDRVYRDSAEEIKESKMRLDFAVEQLAKHPKDAGREYLASLKALESEKGVLEGEIKDYTSGLNALESELKKAEIEVKNLEEAKRKLDLLNGEIKTLEVDYAKANAELEAVKQRLERMNKVTADVEALSEKESQLKKYVEIRDLLSKLEKLKDKQSSMNIDRDRERLMVLRGELTPKPEIERRYSESEKRIKESEAKKAAVEHELSQQESYLKEMESLEGKAKCPRCGQALTIEHMNSEKSIVKENIVKLKDKSTQLKGMISGENESFSQLKESLLKLEKTEAEEKYLKAELERKTGEEKALAEALKFLKEKLDSAGFNDEKLDYVEGKVNDYNKTAGELEQLKGELKQKEDLDMKGRNLSEKLAMITSQKADKGKTLSQMKFNEEDLKKLRQSKDELLKKRYSLENEANKRQYRITETKMKEEETKRKLDEYEKTTSMKEKEEKEIKLLLQAREIFHTDKGIQKYLRDRYIQQLNNLLTYYFKRLNENPRYNEIIFDKNYEIQVRTTEGQMEIEQLSGGEKIQLAIALRIALTEILSHSRLLILDEPFGSLDKSHREILGETLSKIASTGQLIVVTHIHVDSLQLERIELENY